MRKTIGYICIIALLVMASSIGEAAERSWVQVHYDTGISEQTKANVDSAIDVVADMLTEYRLPLRQKLTVIVTADKESYIKVLTQYGGSYEKAAQKAEYTAGISYDSKAIIVLKGSPALQSDRGEVFRVLPHEIFHQVQSQFGHQTTATWMTEAAPELFQIYARERAGLSTVKDDIDKAIRRIVAAKSIPSTSQLMTNKYEEFAALAQQGYPVYQMSLMMIYNLSDTAQFEPVLQFYRLLNQGMSPGSAFVALFRRPQSVYAMEMDKLFGAFRATRQ